MCEVFFKECYKGIPLSEEYDRYMEEMGFKRIAMTGGNRKWSNFIYVKNTLPIHTYNNGIKCYRSGIFNTALDRYSKYVNIHEPLEEVVFEHIFKNTHVSTFLDVGAAWGYYSLLAKQLSPDTTAIAFDPSMKMCKHIERNRELNSLGEIDIRNSAIPRHVSLKNVIKEVGAVDLIKIDIQGAGTKALRSAGSDVARIRNVILGTHGKEHEDCLDLLQKNGFTIKLNLTSSEVPIQPDGLIWGFQG